jgi:ABC-type multidrug transport system fused ATPase/permease subunit
MGFLFLISWPLTLLMLGVAVGKALLTTVFTGRARRMSWRAVEAGKELNARLIESLYGMRLIKTFSREDHEQRRFTVLNAREVHPKIMLRANGALHNFTDGIVALTALCLIVYISLTVWDLRGTLILVYLASVQRVFPILLAINKDRVQLSADLPAVASVVVLTDAARRSAMPNGSVHKSTFDSDIVFDGVEFGYDAARPVLHDIHLRIRKGETVAVVGESGAGKSTLMHLLLRLYDPTSGAIRIDGVDLRRMDLASWHALVSVVSQDTFIFNDTVLENIRYGRLDATDEEIRRAAARAHAAEFIEELEDGFQTVVGDRGVKLSGGQRQRIAIARAFLRNSQVLLLDEATSSLDSVTEKLIEESTRELARNRTTIIIAHRLSTIRTADRILVMHRGEVVEEGPHDVLLLTGALYRRYHDLQSNRDPMVTKGRT